jgi:hypothetical protein
MNVTIQAVEHALLALLKTRQAIHARRLAFLCARTADIFSTQSAQVTQAEQANLTLESSHHTPQAPASFWWVATAFLETLGQSLPDHPVDTTCCKMVAQLLPWWRYQLSKNQVDILMPPKTLCWVDLGHSLLGWCLHAWRLSASLYQPASIGIETRDLSCLSPTALNDFLDLAENTLQKLGLMLKTSSPHTEMNWDVIADLTLLVIRARDLGLQSLADLIQALAHAGGFLTVDTENRVALHTSLSQGHEELTRVLHQLAAGFVKHPQLSLVKALQEEANTLAVYHLHKT